MTLQKRPTLAKRLAQSIIGFNLLLILAGLVLSIRFPVDVFSEFGFVGSWAIASIIYGVLAVLIITRHPGHVVGWLFVIESFLMAIMSLVAFGSGFLGEPPLLAEAGFAIRLVFLLTESIWILALFIPLTLILQFFPDGRLPSRRWWPITLATVIAMGNMLVGFAPDYFELVGTEQYFTLLEDLSVIFFGIAIFGSLAAVVVRFFRSQGTERLQMKWLVYTAVVAILLAIVMGFVFGEDHPINTLYFTMLPSLLGVAIGVAILRNRLFDIDVIIRRTLQYGILTVVLAVIYFGGVVLLQAVATALTGGQNSPIAIVLITLVIAALFNPLRLRIQGFIDRRFYRARYDPQVILSSFATSAQEELDLDALAEELMEAVDETMQPDQVSLWIR